MILEKAFASIIVMLGSAAMIAARRRDYDPIIDPNAGNGISGWTIFLIALIWLN